MLTVFNNKNWPPTRHKLKVILQLEYPAKLLATNPKIQNLMMMLLFTAKMAGIFKKILMEYLKKEFII